MNTNIEVTSIAGFMDWVKATLPSKKEQSKQALFYRGHADENYTLLPSVYRTNGAGKSHRNDESHIYYEMLRRDPSAFANDTTVFERLVRMQHHGLPTRLLDLTQSPLVALFFACESQFKKNGQVMFFHCAQRNVLHQQTLSKLVLAGIECPLTFSNLRLDIYKQLGQLFENECNYHTEHQAFDGSHHRFLADCITSTNNAVDNFPDFLQACAFLQEFNKLVSEFYGEWNKKLKQHIPTLQSVNEKSVVLNARVFLLEFLQRFDYWQVNIIMRLCEQMHIQYNKDWRYLHTFLKELTYFYFVFPPMNNERLRRQRGAFLVCPPAKTDYWTVEHFQKPVVIRIKAKAKKNMLKDLASQDITRSYLFPELEEQAKDIRTLYPPS